MNFEEFFILILFPCGFGVMIGILSYFFALDFYAKINLVMFLPDWVSACLTSVIFTLIFICIYYLILFRVIIVNDF